MLHGRESEYVGVLFLKLNLVLEDPLSFVNVGFLLGLTEQFHQYDMFEVRFGHYGENTGMIQALLPCLLVADVSREISETGYV